MYKVIKHTIEEHHYNHPLLAEQAMSGQTGPDTGIVKKTNPYVKPPKAAKAMSTGELKSILQSYVDTFSTNLISVISFILNNDTVNANKAEEDLYKQVDSVGEFFKSYYGVEFGERLNYSFRTIAIMLFTIARNVKNNYDIKDPVDRLNLQVTGDIAGLLNTYNNLWRIGDVRTIFNQLFAGYKDFIKAKNDKDSGAENSARENINKAYDVLVFNLVNGLTQQMPGYFYPANVTNVEPIR
jgi:hypothetical protein